MPKGTPERITAFDDLDLTQLRIGLRHSAVISKNGDVYTFGSGNWGTLGHGSEDDIHFSTPKQIEYFSKRDIKIQDI